jgi:transcriptional regulator with XRE-family HTH domain
MQTQIKQERQRKRLSREKLANLAGVTGGTIYRAETTGKITFTNYQRIVKALQDYDNNTNCISSN